MSIRICLIEDDPVLGGSMVAHFTGIGFEAVWYRSGNEALRALERGEAPDIVLCDIRLPDINGEDLFYRLIGGWPDASYIFLTAFGSIEQAVRLVKEGADDYLLKPFEMAELIQKINGILTRKLAQRRSRTLLSHLRSRMRSGDGALGFSPAMQKIEQTIAKIRNLPTSLLITGETGTGKEVVANLCHHTSERADKPFIKINCAALPPSLLESELFGYERGAFTGAAKRTIGKIEAANRGTLFLDEIGEAPQEVQVRLLRVLQEKELERVGSTETIPVSVRLVTATNRDLKSMIGAGQLREDFFYRINVLRIHIPPLRDRREDILYLARYFLDFFAQEMKSPTKGLSPRAEAALLAYAFPGNVRELRNMIEGAVALAEHDTLYPTDLFPDESRAFAHEERSSDMRSVVAATEEALILAALAENSQSVGRAAKSLGISRKTLWEKMTRYDIGRRRDKSLD